MNSKNFTAAEKHFSKKQEQYESRIKSLTNLVNEKSAKITELTTENQTLTDENAQLKDWVDRLLKYTELSKDDIKAACKKDIRMSELLGIFDVLSKIHN